MINVLQIKAEIESITPKIWRRFLVKDNITFDKLHETIQIVMGWSNYHLYSFYTDNEQIGISNKFIENESNSKKIKLKDKLSLKQKFNYTYDFGDTWEHVLIVEKILDNNNSYLFPTCISGKRAGPPEDCGGYNGYYRLMEIKKNKKHPEYNDMIKEWLGEDFDFEHFNVEEINKELIKLQKVDGRKRYWVQK
ncbi:plasmid pRiA4b ORF-3 family protein [Candidatus Woesearchaeota archaeon]|nr:plasmid pRiA4b ORF-3 family protein [Candidatus Woesearchaeota archaeon]